MKGVDLETDSGNKTSRSLSQVLESIEAGVTVQGVSWTRVPQSRRHLRWILKHELEFGHETKQEKFQ